MKLYVAIIDGMYRHEILGIYDDEHLAATMGIEFVTLEEDHYHTVDIVEIELNKSANIEYDEQGMFGKTKGKESAEKFLGLVRWDKKTKRAEYNKILRCIVCDDAGIMEPRFGYVVCKKHENIPPSEINKS